MEFSSVKYCKYMKSLQIEEDIPTGKTYVNNKTFRTFKNHIVFKNKTDKSNYVLLEDSEVESYITTRRAELKAEKKAAQEARLAELKEARMQSQEVETETTTETKTE